jgi:hypothetical protein
MAVMSGDGAPKSSYELAMERLRQKDASAGVERRPLSDEQKAAIAEVRSVYGAKLAQVDLMHQSRVNRTFDPAARELADEEYRRDREHLTAEMESKVEKLRLGNRRSEQHHED